MTDAPRHGAYGTPPERLAALGPDAVQFSPLMPGADALEDCAPGSLAGFTMLAPPGTLERRYALAGALRALAPGAAFQIMAPRDRGGARLAGELELFGCTVIDTAKSHHRICAGTRPAAPAGLDAALAEAGPCRVPPHDLWTQPGVFSWDRLDPGSALLMAQLPPLAGHGADFGCGIGTLALSVLTSDKVKSLVGIDLDRRAVAAARRNLDDGRVTLRWGDLRVPDAALAKLDFAVMNPPFHEAGAEERSLGRVFVARAAAALRRGGRLWLVANRHLAYEAVLQPLFRTVRVAIEQDGYKVFEATL